MNNNKIKLDISKLPLIIEFENNGNIKTFILKPNKDKSGVFINRLEQY